jgi:dethiobiotin synthetase
MPGLFVTGTGTGVGKTVLSAALLAAMAATGERVRAHKPVVTGLDDRTQSEWPPDHELLASVAGMHGEEVAPLRYGPAVSPHLAARLAGEAIDPVGLVARARAAAIGEETLIVE